MSSHRKMLVEVRLPDRLLYRSHASKLYAQAENGAFGLLPNHADFVSGLVPSVLIITEETGQERFFGVDQGLLVKHGPKVSVAVHRGLEGNDLTELATQVGQVFTAADEGERQARSALARLELGMMKQFAELRKPVL